MLSKIGQALKKKLEIEQAKSPLLKKQFNSLNSAVGHETAMRIQNAIK